jgi:hypothetical protein
MPWQNPHAPLRDALAEYTTSVVERRRKPVTGRSIVGYLR